MSIDLRGRQQQVDAMRGELQKSGTCLAAERQQTEQQSAMLMGSWLLPNPTHLTPRSAASNSFLNTVTALLHEIQLLGF